MRHLASIVSILAVLAVVNPACGRQPDAEQVMAALTRNIDAINDYRVDVSMSVKGPKISIKNMGIRIYYKKPDKVHIEARQGFAVVPQGSFFGNPIAELTRHTKPVYVKSEKKHGRACHVMKLVAKQAGNNAPDVLIWVDKQRSVLVATKVEGETGFSSSWRYATIDGKYYLPVQITIDLPMGKQGAQDNRATAIVKFNNYVVNKGINDKVFEKQPTNKK